jgi:Flp pilus assembly pilin Flp
VSVFSVSAQAGATNEAMRMNPILANLRSLVPEFLSDERGARTIEIGLLAVGIVVACIATAAALGTGLEPDGGRVSAALTASLNR